MLPEKTREQFEKVIESQLARIQAMKDQGDFIDDHREETSSDWIPRIALPGSGRIMHHAKLEIK